MDQQDANNTSTPLGPAKNNHTALGCGCLSLVAVVVIVFMVYAVNSGDKLFSASSASTTAAAPAATPATTATADPAQELADLDGESGNVGAYQIALDALAPKCTQDAVHIAGLGDAGYQDLVKNGVTDETRLTVLQHLSDSIPASMGKTDCTSMLSAYLVLRENG